MSDFKNVSGVVIGLATIGLGFNSVINTIAGVQIDIDGGTTFNHFKVNLDVSDGVKNYALNLDKQSLQHWKDNFSKEEIRELTRNQVPYEEGIRSFVEWYKSINPKKVWFHCGHFHSPILKNSFESVLDQGYDPLWYNNVCDTLTIQNVFGDAPKNPGNDPMDKILVQGQYIIDFFNSLKD